MSGRWPADAWRGRLLVVRLSSLGDVVLTTGPLRLLRERRPDLSIDFLTRRAHAPALAGLPGIDRVLVADDASPAVSDAAYDRVLDWQGGSKGARAAARLAPGVGRIGYPHASFHRRSMVAFGCRIRPPRSYVARLARSIAGEWIDPARLRPATFVDPERVERVRAWLAERGRPRNGWVVLAPHASRALKEVPAPLVTALGERCRDAGCGVVRIEPPSEACETAGEGAARGAIEATFRGSVEDVIAVLAAARLFIGGDSGILHLATAVGTPAVGLYGCTVPELGFSPLGNAAAVGVDLPCRPCHVHGARRCWLGHRRCWTGQSSDRIWKEAIARLEPASGDA